MGTRNLFHTNRTLHQECLYWIRDERNKISPNEWVYQNQASGIFYAKEASPRYNQINQVGGVFAFDRNSITLETEDDVSMLTRGCLVKYNGDLWMVDTVQRVPHKKETEFDNEIDYKYIVSMIK